MNSSVQNRSGDPVRLGRISKRNQGKSLQKSPYSVQYPTRILDRPTEGGRIEGQMPPVRLSELETIFFRTQLNIS
jgi:hypothetical protein